MQQNFIIRSAKSRGKISLLNFKFRASSIRLRALNLVKFIARNGGGLSLKTNQV